MKSVAVSAGLWLAGACAVLPIAAHSESEWVRYPTAVGTSIDVGQIVKGRLVGESDADTVKGDGQFLTRTGVYLTKSATFNDKLNIQLTLGGLFWFALPEQKDNPARRFLQFGPGVGQAQASYTFGSSENPSAKLQFGFFPIKYNPDAKNLGEYLYRSGTYPTLRYNGGWSYINSAAYMAQGIRFTWNSLGGKLIHDFTFTMERDLQPNYDISPGYLVTWKPATFLEIGVGGQWAHGLPLVSKNLSPKTPENAYVKATKLPLNYRDTTNVRLNQKHYNSNDPRVQPDGDTCLTDFTVACSDGTFNNGTFVSTTGNGIPGEQLGYYTFKGFKLMARASLDFGSMLGAEGTFGKDAFKLYGEWALLGVEDQPFYYDDKTERMPVMFGMNLPTFKILDMLCVEVEHLKSRFRNNMNVIFRTKWPIPVAYVGEVPEIYDLNDSRYTDTLDVNFRWLPEDVGHVDLLGSQRKMAEQMKRDDWKWSVYARKQITNGFTIFAQVASDNQRQITWQYGPRFMDFPATEFTGDWYYVLRMEFGI